MRSVGARLSPPPARDGIITELRARLAEAEATLRAIRSGGVDALVVAGRGGPRVFTLEGEERAYRALIESMNEGALMLSHGALILYANRRFARMIGRPLSRVLGSPLQRFLSEGDHRALRRVLNRVANRVATLQVHLHAANGEQVPAQVSVHRLNKSASAAAAAAYSIVVTDMTEARRAERTLRSLSHSLLRTQETDRRRLALDLHERATQGLSALLIRVHLLADGLPARARSLRREATAIGELLGRTAEVVESISRDLRPSVLEILGLLPALRAAAAGFEKRTGIPVKLVSSEAPTHLSAEAELMLYRVLEEALRNVEQHAGARNVVARLGRRGADVILTIRDDGVGFDPGRVRPTAKKKRMGLVSLQERLASVGGTLAVESLRGRGTTVAARIPLPGPARAGVRGSLPAARSGTRST